MKICQNSMSLGSTIPNMSRETTAIQLIWLYQATFTTFFFLGVGYFFFSIFKTEWFVFEKGRAVFIPSLAEWWVYWNTLVRPSVPKPCVRN